MTAARRPALYPDGSTLRCGGCGRVDDARKVTGHVARGKCYGSRLEVVTWPAGTTSITHRVAQAARADLAALSAVSRAEGMAPVAEAAAEAEPAEQPAVPVPDEVEEEVGDDEADVDDDEEEGDEEMAFPPEDVGRSTSVGTLTGAAPARTRTASSGRRSGPAAKSMRLQRAGTTAVTLRNPYRTQMVIDVLPSTVATMQAMFDDPEEFDFLDGTPSDFFDKITQLAVLLLRRRDGARCAGVRLVWQRPEPQTQTVAS